MEKLDLPPVPKKDLQNANAVLVLGIISIVTSICYGLPGLICSIIALVMVKKPKEEYASAPQLFTLSSYNNLNAGRICAIIGLVLSILMILFVILFVIIAVATNGRILGSRYGF